MLDHRIENDQQFSHARHEGDLFAFARGTQALIEGPDDGIEAGGDEGPHFG